MLDALPRCWIDAGPDSSGFQQEAEFTPGDPVRVPAGKGKLIIIEE